MRPRRIVVPGHGNLSRRALLQAGGLTALGMGLAACQGSADEGGTAAQPSPSGTQAPEETFTEPTTKLSGELSILLWSHFVPAHDEWFDPFVKEWGDRVGVSVTVDHVNVGDVPARIASEIQAGQGHDLLQYIAPLSQYEPSVLDMTDLTEEAGKRHGQQLDLVRRSSFNPATGKFYAYAPGWVPDPGDYRRSLWEQAGFPDGPSTWDELLEGGSRIKTDQGVQMGIGMSQEIDSNMAGRALLWSFGASIQDESERVVINSPETVQAIDFMRRLFEGTMTNEVFSWNASSNNQGLIAGQMSFILNSISAWRTAQEARPDVASDVFFVPALEGPGGQWAAQHVLYNWIVPNHAGNPDAAQEFLLHYTANWPAVTYHSKLYDFPAFPDLVPQLGDWLASDPFGAQPADKLAFLSIEDTVKWSTNVGHPGPSNTAVGEIFGTHIIPNMFAKAARGEMTPEQAAADAEAQITPIFDKWRSRGLVGGA